MRISLLSRRLSNVSALMSFRNATTGNRLLKTLNLDEVREALDVHRAPAEPAAAGIGDHHGMTKKFIFNWFAEPFKIAAVGRLVRQDCLVATFCKYYPSAGSRQNLQRAGSLT